MTIRKRIYGQTNLDSYAPYVDGNRSVWHRFIAVFAVVPFLIGSDALALPDVPGYTVEVFANLSVPTHMTFDESGNMYVGTASSGPIRQIPPSGGSFSDFGPDLGNAATLVYDASDAISGIAGSIIVGAGSSIWAVHPDQSATLLFNAGVFSDQNDMILDGTGRLLFSDDASQVIEIQPGGSPAVLFATLERPASVDVDAADDIFVGIADGRIRKRNPNGSGDSDFVTGLVPGLGAFRFRFSDGGPFGTDLYVINGANLVQIDASANVTQIGMGFNDVVGVRFGPDGALYVSERSNGRILRISKASSPLDHFLCYDAKTSKGEQALEPIVVDLADQFGEIVRTVVKSKYLCNPVDKNGEGVNDPQSHLTCYWLNDDDEEADRNSIDVTVDNQFGPQGLTVKKPKMLCVPSTKEIVANPE